MRAYVPPVFLEELTGIARGAGEVGADYKGEGGAGIAKLVRRMIMLVEIATIREMNLDDIDGLIGFLETGRSTELRRLYGELPPAPEDPAAPVPPPGFAPGSWAMAGPEPRLPFATCSFFAAWGANTRDGHLFASRNLDWTSNTGLNEQALITVYVPTTGHPYATVGYVGMAGAIAGLSDQGIAVAHVGSTSVLERLQAEPGMLKSRELLWLGESLDDSLDYIANQVADGRNRPNSIGANVLAAWGDPLGQGASAQAAAIENTGGVTAVFLQRPDCTEEALVFTFDAAGALDESLDAVNHPDRVNLEGDTYEVDGQLTVRRFVLGEDGRPLRDEDGYPVESLEGQPLKVGKPLPCALFRGDEAMAYEVRQWQEAARGPWSGSGRGLMIDSGSYNGRYLVMHDMIQAQRTGTGYVRDGREVIVAPADGSPRPLGPPEAVQIAQEAAMSSNILSVVYDATALDLYVAFEKGAGEAWEPASRKEYVRFSLPALLGRRVP